MHRRGLIGCLYCNNQPARSRGGLSRAYSCCVSGERGGRKTYFPLLTLNPEPARSRPPPRVPSLLPSLQDCSRFALNSTPYTLHPTPARSRPPPRVPSLLPSLQDCFRFALPLWVRSVEGQRRDCRHRCLRLRGAVSRSSQGRFLLPFCCACDWTVYPESDRLALFDQRRGGSLLAPFLLCLRLDSLP